MEKEVEVIIDPMGRVTIDAKNFNGVGCEAATKALEQALSPGEGGVTRVMKPEWYETEEANQRLHEHQW